MKDIDNCCLFSWLYLLLIHQWLANLCFQLSYVSFPNLKFFYFSPKTEFITFNYKICSSFIVNGITKYPAAQTINLGVLWQLFTTALLQHFKWQEFCIFNCTCETDISPKKTYRWLTNTWKDAQHHSLSEKCKSKPQWGTITRQSGWLLSKSLQAINAGEGVEKREPSYTVGGNSNEYSH